TWPDSSPTWRRVPCPRPHASSSPPRSEGRDGSQASAQTRVVEARPGMAVVPVGVLSQILLVVLLGVVEVAEGGDLGGDLSESVVGQDGLIDVQRPLRLVELAVGRGEDRRAVLRADVIALAITLGRVVGLPEDPKQLVVADL